MAATKVFSRERTNTCEYQDGDEGGNDVVAGSLKKRKEGGVGVVFVQQSESFKHEKETVLIF